MLGLREVENMETWFKHLATQANDRSEGMAFAIALKLQDIRNEARSINYGISVVAVLLVALIGLLWWKL